MIRETEVPLRGLRTVPGFVAAQMAGILGGLAVGLDQIAATPPRRRIVERAVTRC